MNEYTFLVYVCYHCPPDSPQQPWRKQRLNTLLIDLAQRFKEVPNMGTNGQAVHHETKYFEEMVIQNRGVAVR